MILTIDIPDSALSKRDLEENGWEFGGLIQFINAAYTAYLDQWGENPRGDITLPVRKPTAEEGLTSGIVKYLGAERERMENAVLSLPADWTVSPALFFQHDSQISVDLPS
jgi:hypothetical protein